ncbi:hypothetical protein [Streptomyces albicerus]|jgi:hypothetical protein|uniref:hypothetical protein n=1 Tax=Streptomyces albicerus TaxID=2569859 RepID=UPI00124BB072|nr:hypothetical protein [Streptomyces albicerus]
MRLQRYYAVADGTPVGRPYDAYPEWLWPVPPCHRSAFDALIAWVERGTQPPAGRALGRPASGNVVNSCALEGN